MRAGMLLLGLLLLLPAQVESQCYLMNANSECEVCACAAHHTAVDTIARMRKLRARCCVRVCCCPPHNLGCGRMNTSSEREVSGVRFVPSPFASRRLHAAGSVEGLGIPSLMYTLKYMLKCTLNPLIPTPASKLKTLNPRP